MSQCSKAWLLNLNTTDISDQRILSCGRLSLHCRIYCRFFSISWLDARNPPNCDKQTVSRYWQKCLLGRGEEQSHFCWGPVGHRAYGKRACSMGQKSWTFYLSLVGILPFTILVEQMCQQKVFHVQYIWEVVRSFIPGLLRAFIIFMYSVTF